MVQFVYTPWRDRTELLAVRRQFYPSAAATATPTTPTTTTTTTTTTTPSIPQRWPPDELEGVKKAIARVFMWMHRGNCPHVVESTALLMSAVVQDGKGGDDTASSFAIRASYLMAFTRFVTGLLDSHQDKARKLSMYGVAKTVGLPASFVELRHQGTHEPMPSTTQLRPAARKALVWIWEYYWKNLPDEDDNFDTASEHVSMGGSTATATGAGTTGGKGATTTSALKGRMCRGALMGYLTRQEGEAGEEAAKEALMRQLRQWDDVLVLKVMEKIAESVRDSGMLVRLVKLSREFLTWPQGSTKGEDGEEEMPRDIDELKKEVSREIQKLEQKGKNEGATMGNNGRENRVGDDEDVQPGWSRWVGPWTPRPIGIL